MKPIIISIITATFNPNLELLDLFESLRNQNCYSFEWIIIDCMSSKGALDQLQYVVNNEKIGFPIKIFREYDDGIYDAFNKGIQLSSGEWIYFIGSDDILHANSIIESIVKISKSNPNLDLIIGNTLISKINPRLFISTLSWKINIINTIHHQSAFYRKRVFLNFSYSKEFKVVSDYELNFRIYQLRIFKTLKINNIIAICNDQGISHRSREIINYLQMHIIRKKYISEFRSYVFLLFSLINLLKSYFIYSSKLIFKFIIFRR